jgi:benzoylformate decarboxylase
MTARGLNVEKPARTEGPTVRDAVMTLLRELGMTTLFGNPGSTELPLFRDMPQDFRYILGLQESVVVGMADGFAQMSGNAAFVNLHSSAGTGHALGNIFTAYRNQTPLVITAGQQARSIFPYDPFLYAERATEFPQPFVKWTAEPARAEDVPLAILRAYHMAMQAPRGPVFVSVPIDDWDRPCAPIGVSRVSQTTAASPTLLNLAAEALDKAKSPVIVAGAGVGRDNARGALAELAQVHQAPVWVAPMAARAVFPEDHALFAGFLPASREAIVNALDGHDLVLVLGAPVFTYHVEGFGPYLPDGSSLIQIVDDPGVAARTPVGTAIVGNVAEAIVALTIAANPAARSAPVITVPALDEAVSGTAISEVRLMQRLTELRPKGIIMSEEAPSTRGPLHDHFPIRLDDEFTATASGGLGFALPAAVGAALAQPNRTVFCLLGDGSAMYSIQGLWTAADMKLDIRFLIVNNGGYAALDQFGALFDIEVVGSKLPGLDFVKLAEGMGVPGARVAHVDDLDDAIRALFAGSGPRLLEVVVQRPGAH